MPCAAPLTAYRPANGGPLYWSPPTDGRAANKIQVPCGTCILCREEHARQWACRLTHERTLHQLACFGTLTYDDQHLPLDHGTPTLNYRDTCLFLKRVRKNIGPFRYYLVGEYGDENQRPHYHFCMFGHAFIDRRLIIKEKPFLLWTNHELEQLWGMGNVSVGDLTYESARYTASYVTKKLRAKKTYSRVDEQTGELIPLVQPKAFMSLKPAIGHGWWTKWNQGIKDHDHVIINGRPQKPPKYYDRLLKTADEQRYNEIKEQRKEKSETETLESLRARAIVAHARRHSTRAKSKKV